MDSETIIYNALSAYNATKTLGDNAKAPFVVFAIDKEISRTRDRDYQERIELVVDIVTTTASAGEVIASGIISNLKETTLTVSRYGVQDSVIEEEFVKTLDFTLVNTL